MKKIKMVFEFDLPSGTLQWSTGKPLILTDWTAGGGVALVVMAGGVVK